MKAFHRCLWSLATVWVALLANGQETEPSQPASEQAVAPNAQPSAYEGFALQFADPQGAQPSGANPSPSTNATDVANLVWALRGQLLADNPLGIEVAPVEAPLRVHLKLPEAEGVIVTSAPPESEGAKAGLQQHDVILRVVETPVADAATFLQTINVGGEKPLKLKVLRAGKPIEIEAAPKRLRVVNVDLGHNLAVLANAQFAFAGDDRYRIGVSLAEVDPALRAHLKLPEGQGLLVTEVIPNSPAAEGGVQANDILMSLDGAALTNVEKINEQIQSIKDRKVTLKLLRAGEEQSIEIAPRKNPAASGDSTPQARWWVHPSVTQSLNCQTCHANAHQETWLQYQHFFSPHTAWPQYFSLRLPDSGDAGAQINKLKTQLGEMQATIAALEASLASSQQKQQQQQQQSLEKPKDE
jgi:S1-C subfamily serine protease